MADMDVKVRLTGDGGQLVGQLNAVAAAEQGVAKGADQVTASSARAATATDQLSASEARARTALNAFAQAQAAAKVGTSAAKAELDAGSISLAKYNAMLLASKANLSTFAAEHNAAQKALRKTSDTSERATQSMGSMRSASANLGFQIQDITQSLALGMSPMVVFGQQAGQTAAAVAGMGGTVGRVGTFLAGPWGSLVLAAVTVLGMFAASNSKAEQSARDLGDGIDFQRMTVGELINAITDLEAAQRRQIRTSYESEQAALKDAQASLTAARSKREQVKAELELALARFNEQSAGSKGGAEIKAAQGYQASVLQSQLDQLNASILKAESLERAAKVPVLRREAAAATDGAAAATLRYDKAEASLTQRFVEGRLDSASYQRQLEALKNTRESETKAARAQEKQAKATNAAYKGRDLAAFGSPVDGGRISSGYGVRTAPTKGASTNHLGVDYAVPEGTPIRATQAGVVKRAAAAGGYGNQVGISHGAGTETRYSHLSRFAVSENQAVERGQIIGYAGSTGTATGSHLHYEVLVNGKKVNPNAGKFPFDPAQVADVANRAAQELEQFGARAGESIQQIAEQYDAQPKLIDQVARSTRKLDSIIKELGDRKPAGFEKMIAEAEAAKGVVEASLVRPFQQMQEQAAQAADIQSLILAGRDDEAAALQQIYALQEQVGFVTRDQREAILANARAEREINEALQQRQEQLGSYQSAISDVRGQLENLLGGMGDGNIAKNLKRTFQQLQGRILTEKIFGPALRQLDEYVRQKTGIQSSVDIMKSGTEQAGKAALGLAATFKEAMAQMRSTAAAPDNGPAVLSPEFMAAIDQTPQPSEADRQQAADTAEILVTAKKVSRGAMGLTPQEFFGTMTRDMVGPMLDGLDRIFGTEFFGKLSGVLSGALEGYVTAGPVGAVLGGLKGIKGLPESITKALGKSFEGAQTGYQIAQIGKSLGMKTSSTGGAIGGAVGALTGIPGGQIIGSIIGSVVGGLFKKTPKGTVTINGEGSSYAGSGKLRDGLTSAGTAVGDSLRSIADQLGGDVGTFSATIRQKGKKVYANGVRVDDLDAAAQKVIGDALASGAITGLSAAVSKALASSPDTQKAVNEALKVKELEKLLGGFMGSARDAFQNFERQAKERLRMATAYGFELNKVEELNAKERVKLRTQLEREAFGSLQDLLDSMKSGSLFEGSAVDQRKALLTDIEAARASAARGDEGAADKLAQLLEQLNAVSRDVYGTTGGFAADRSTIEGTATNVISLLRTQLDSADPNATNELLDENNAQNAQIIAELKALGVTLAATKPAATATPQTAPAFDLSSLAYTGGYGAGISGGIDLGSLNFNIY